MRALQKLDRAEFEAKASAAARFLRAIANEHRLMILCRLGEGEKSVGELCDLIGLQPSALSQHLARLRADGIVGTRRQAQTIFYRLTSPDAVRLITTLAAIFCPPPGAKSRRTAS
ncbi:MAG TPA: metalloregulator ArsR/SmtB family transcription factor [Hypericibacter adhaerens]|jgi:ArsR family transcriptional regulator|uniref:Transcriptional regulator n=1 Tax=Hypericibacter adhaerens TaxID=2602016 RepID=A0A5J6N0N5_9PROT|nr:metalloregulator ArsR/SmtB family transcription factor [Hypericibacter adhaerens]QEX22804.1 transcriptional regulator [Hypericibacter adhaerens]HWA44954.1 metalloregulator ArsR/SmtB family transcription factor [Hypericibacter adhaerens]